MQPFNSQTYIQRRAQLCAKVNKGIIVLMGNEEAPMNYTDNVYHFRQDSTFLYYFRVNKPGYIATLDCDSGESTLYGYNATMDDVIWTGPVPTLAEEAQMSGLTRFGGLEDFERDIKAAMGLGREIHFLPPYRGDNAIKLGSILSIKPSDLKSKASQALIMAIISQRSYKTSEEIFFIEQALNITREMHIAAVQVTKPNMYEYETVSEIQRICHSYDAEFAYGVIFTVNGQILHNHGHHNKMEAGRMVINDSGVETSTGYASDITRSFPVDKKFTNKQKEIYSIVYEMEMNSIASLKPGVYYRDAHIASNRLMLQGLSDLGLVHGDIETMTSEGVGGLFMPHGLGHMMGLDVHDMEDLGENYVGYTSDMQRSTQLGLKSLRLARKLEKGFVLTVEPGIYFIPELIQKWKAEGKFTQYINYSALESYFDFGGIRIEDNVWITDDGQRVLGEHIPKTIDEIEDLKSSNAQ